jgi:hypothetical protein
MHIYTVIGTQEILANVILKQANVYFNISFNINSLNAMVNSICDMLAVLGAHHIFHVSMIRVNNSTEHCNIVPPL